MQDPEQAWSIGSYRVEKRLGRGGMGEVFLGYDDRLGRRVAIKRVRRGPELDRLTLRRCSLILSISCRVSAVK